MPSIVALDIETTGLDPQTDAILEIGAVRFSGRRTEDEWSTLVNPGRPIPPFITSLTGITGDMVRGAPTLRSVLPDLVHFAADAPILGHNVGFDLSFLRKQGVLTLNESADTYDLAAILLPTASRYNLSFLAKSLGILLPATHRALDDARVTAAVFNHLYEQAAELPLELIAEFVRMSEQVPGDTGWAFRQLLRAKARGPVSAKRAGRSAPSPLFPSPEPAQTRQGEPCPVPYEVEELAALLDGGGPFSRRFPGYEQRNQQVEMLRSVAEAFGKSRHLMVEAGTGTGKSFAYLVPAAVWAMQNGKRVVISTNTINLQDQLIKKDIPDLCAALSFDLRSAVLKGRSNYLCPRRLELMRQRGPETPEEMRVLAKILVWLQSSQTGDRSEINLNGPAERDVWSHLCAEDEGCRTDICIKRTGGACPYYQARQAAQAAHLLVINHALLLADISVGSRVLPEYDRLIIDEAHHLESAATTALSFKLSVGDVDRMLRELGGVSSGLLGRYLHLTRDVLPPADYAGAGALANRCTDEAFHLQEAARTMFRALDQFLEDQRDGRPLGMYSQQQRILPATRTLPAWSEVEIAWDAAARALSPLLGAMQNLFQLLATREEDLSEEVEELQNNLSSLYRRFLEVQTVVNEMLCKPLADRVYWVEAQANGSRLNLQAAPLHIGPLMERLLWNEKESVVLTSATLTTNGEFDYLRSRLNAHDAGELALDSPFDFENSALLYVVNDIPEPSDIEGHQRAVERSLHQLALATGGRMLALFTNYDKLKRCSQRIGPALAEHGITVYEQGEGASASTLLEVFRESEKAVLLGTRSFWEGVDIAGEALSVLAIVKLPFDVPSEPIVAARSETFDDPFNEYNLPEAILRFRQGFGRLIRTQSDRGVVAILDKRILTKRYGQAFMDSIPHCKKVVGPAADLPARAATWLRSS